MWASTFGGRLPAASELVLRYAPRTAAPAVGRTLPGRSEMRGRPRRKVPGPMAQTPQAHVGWTTLRKPSA